MLNDPWQAIRDLRQDVRELRSLVDHAITRISDLEADAPQARQLQLEADLALADLAESGYDHHGQDCQFPYCYDPDDYDDYDPGPECDDQGGMSEYQHPLSGDSEAYQS
jgi:hypothetical protein